MALKDAPTSVLLENVLSLIHQKLPKNSASLVECFVAKFYGNMASTDLHDRNDSDLYGAALSLWNALNQRTSTEPYIRVYNPELTRHGWQSPHTIVEVILQDSPFLVDSIRMALKRLNITAHMMLHQPLHLIRGADGKIGAILDLDNTAGQTSVETAFLIEIDHLTGDDQMEALAAELNSVAGEVALAVGDWQPMLGRLNEIIDEFGGWAIFQQLLQVLQQIGRRHGASIASVATKGRMPMKLTSTPLMAGIHPIVFS